MAESPGPSEGQDGSAPPGLSDSSTDCAPLVGNEALQLPPQNKHQLQLLHPAARPAGIYPFHQAHRAYRDQ